MIGRCIRNSLRHAIVLSTWLTAVSPCWGEVIQSEFAGQDTLDPGPEVKPEAQQSLAQLAWSIAPFRVRVEPADSAKHDYDALVRFPSPVETGDSKNDEVCLEWYAARHLDPSAPCPALVVVHESGKGMVVGRLFAQNLRSEKLHTFLLHLPHYGERRVEGEERDPSKFVPALRQGVADVRRARDAIAALPQVGSQRVGLQGTSLGGFVCATVAGLDRGYSRVFITLAGGNLYEVIQQGDQDAANVRNMLQKAGVTDQQLREALNVIEPLRLAHRIEPHGTWIFSAKQDRVVPLKHATQLAEAADLDPEHHVQVEGDHYTAILHFPLIVARIREQMER